MAEFKVGDRVRALRGNLFGDIRCGEVVEVRGLRVLPNGITLVIAKGKRGGICSDAVQLVADEPADKAGDWSKEAVALTGPHGYVATGQEAETIVTDEATGGRKAQKAAQLGSIDPKALYTLAEVAGMGAGKYERFNYLRGYDWSLSVDAAYRHFLKFQAGEDCDPESGLPHVAHAAWHMLCLLSFQQRGLGNDDRFKQKGDQ